MPNAAPEADYPIPLSEPAEHIRQAIRQPLDTREPTTYQLDFLNHYRPNEDFYLPANVRQHLATVGQTREENQPAGTYARQILNRLLVDLSWNSSRLEGNTYSLLETERLLRFGETAQGRNVLEAQMILNHKAAIEFLLEGGEDLGFNRYTVLGLHALLSDNLLPNPAASGALRQIPVGITQTAYTPLDVPQQIEEAFDLILAKAQAIIDPFEQSFFAMVHVPYLQAFEEVNKRVSRLAANIPLIQQNLSPLSFADVPEQAYIDGILGVYELNRIELLRDVYVWAYERSSARYAKVRQTLGEPDPFRLQYRDLLKTTVNQIVREGLNQVQASQRIAELAKTKLPSTDEKRFIEVVETELISLHEGNIARYRLRPAEFKKWLTGWE